MKVGIDAGGTLIKIVQESQQGRSYETKLTTNISEVIAWLNANTLNQSVLLAEMQVLFRNLNVDATIFVEFDASSKGLGMLLKEQGHHIDEYIFANVGTGTSLHYFDGKQQRRGRCGYWWRYDSRTGILIITNYRL